MGLFSQKTINKHFHFIGIGGIGMAGLAGLVLAKGGRVSGSDVKENKMVKDMRGQGAFVTIGHHADALQNPDYVVVSTAIKIDNPELVKARELCIPVMRRAELLACLMSEFKALTVTGAHGKTSTSSMIYHMLNTADLSPTAAIGGVVQSLESNMIAGQGQYFVAEVDDSDGTHLHFFPYCSVITNMDKEHMDFYRDMDHIAELYLQYMKQTKPDGCLFVCGEDKPLVALAKTIDRKIMTYGFSSECHAVASNLTLNGFNSSFDFKVNGENLGRFQLNVPGQHNVLNSLACILVGLYVGIKPEVIKASLMSFSGVQRRFQKIGEFQGALVYDDYAHHPTEIRQTLKVARQACPAHGRVVAVFQPHRYTRLHFLWEEFLQCFEDADVVLVTDVYSASEKPIKEVNGENFAEQLKNESKKVIIFAHRDQLSNAIKNTVRSDDLLLTLGAGDVTQLGYGLTTEADAKGVLLKK